MKRRSGHNLLEMIAAAFVFLVASMGLAGVWMQHAKAMGMASHRLIAQHLAQEQMEECIGAKFRNVDGLQGVRPLITMNEVVKGKALSANYVTVVNVTPEDPVEHWKVVTVTVYWKDAAGLAQLQYKTLLAKAIP